MTPSKPGCRCASCNRGVGVCSVCGSTLCAHAINHSYMCNQVAATRRESKRKGIRK